MGKCTCPKHRAASKRKAIAKSKPKGKCGKRGGHPANMFILYFLDYWRKNGGNMYCVAKLCGQKWKTLSDSEKEKFKRQYCSRCKNCKSCQRKTTAGKKC